MSSKDFTVAYID